MLAYIWANYNISLSWMKAIWGSFPLLTMIIVYYSEVAVRSWSNLSRYIPAPAGSVMVPLKPSTKNTRCIAVHCRPGSRQHHCASVALIRKRLSEPRVADVWDRFCASETSANPTVNTLWWTNITIWKITMFNGKMHYFYGHVQLLMLVHQRVSMNEYL